MITNKISPSYKSNPDDPLTPIDRDLTTLFTAMEGRIRFGTGANGKRGENIHGEFQVFTSNAIPDTSDSITHTLGSVPVGFFIVNINKGAVVYDSGVAWTASTISLKTTVASTLITLFLLK